MRNTNSGRPYDAATIQKIIEDIIYLQLDESDKSYGFSSDRMREYLKVTDINVLLRKRLNEAMDAEQLEKESEKHIKVL